MEKKQKKSDSNHGNTQKLSVELVGEKRMQKFINIERIMNKFTRDQKTGIFIEATMIIIA